MTVEKMQDRLIHKYGMEHPLIIWFIDLCEKAECTKYNRECLYNVYISIDDAIENEMDME